MASLDGRRRSDKTMTLQEAVTRFLKKGMSLSFGGMGGGTPAAAVHEIARHRDIDELTLIVDSPCDPADILIGTGQVKKIEMAYVGYGVAGLAHNFRRAVEAGIPHPIEVEEYSNFSMGLRFLAGALNIPFLPCKSLLGSDIPKYNTNIIITSDPYKGDVVALVPAAQPDVAIVHVHRADRRGNAQLFGHWANSDNIARAAKCTIITCEELVSEEEIRRYPNLTFLPEYYVDAVVEVPFGCHPNNMTYCYEFDFPFHKAMNEAFRTRDGFERWMEEWVYSLPSWEAYLEKVGRARLSQLVVLEKMFHQPPIPIATRV